VSDENLDPANFPELMNLSWNLLDPTQIYCIFNTFYLFLWVGKDTDSYYLYELFGTESQA